MAECFVCDVGDGVDTKVAAEKKRKRQPQIRLTVCHLEKCFVMFLPKNNCILLRKLGSKPVQLKLEEYIKKIVQSPLMKYHLKRLIIVFLSDSFYT